MTTTTLIGLDWGTSSLRAFRFASGGAVAETRSVARGILAVAGGAFEQAFTATVGDWLDAAPDAPVLLSGMIGSRQGWQEAAYVPCPAGEPEIVAALSRLTTTRGRVLRIVPGCSILAEDGVPDVMRGEETQILGELDGKPQTRLMVLPGTHSKWALCENGRLVWFATFMTGELYAALKDHTILGRLAEGEADDPAAAARGLELGLGRDPGSGGLLRRLFSARTRGLFGEIPPTGVASYLSALLIGSEIAEALACVERRARIEEVTVIGASGLVARYDRALAAAGVRARRGRDDAAARGQWRIAVAAGLVRESHG
jgi:2-dehydro-3-deoxygalactonokinase